MLGQDFNEVTDFIDQIETEQHRDECRSSSSEPLLGQDFNEVTDFIDQIETEQNHVNSRGRGVRCKTPKGTRGGGGAKHQAEAKPKALHILQRTVLVSVEVHVAAIESYWILS